MKYPTVSEYIESLRIASDDLVTLTSLKLVLGTGGNPIYSKEGHGIVFRMKDGNTDLEYDVKCFTDEQEGREALYEQINNSHGQGVWFPDGVTYYANELFVDTMVSDDNEFPIVVIPCCKTTSLISFIRTNIDDIILISKLADSFSCVVEWVKEKGYSWHELNVDSLYVDDAGHVVVSDIDEHVVIANTTEKNDDINAYLIFLSLKALSRDLSLFNVDDIKPYILFDGNYCNEFPTSKIVIELLKIGDPKILSIVGDVFVKIGHGNYGEMQTGLQRSEACEEDLKMMADKEAVTRQLELARKCWDNEMYEDAYRWYELAATRNNAEGIFGLGLCYKKGLGVEKDEKRAFQCFLKATELGLLEAQFEVAEAYQDGKGVQMDSERAFDLYYKSAQKGHKISEFMVGWYLMRNFGVMDNAFITTRRKDTVKAFEWFMKSALQGYHPAQRRIGAFYESGTNPCVRNIEKALEWYKKAAEQGNDKAIFAIGRLYANGLDERNPDHCKAFEYYLQAANKGLREAQYRVGISLLFGKGISKDADAAIEWIKKSANQGYSAAKTLICEIESDSEEHNETEATGLELASAIMDEYGVLYSQDGRKLLKYSMEEGYGNECKGVLWMSDEELEFGKIKQQSLNRYEVKEGTEIICDNSFNECESLQSIVFPKSLKTIGEFAFCQCENLEYVGINEGLVKIGNFAFSDCENLHSLKINENLEQIGNYAFDGCVNLESLVLPGSLKSIESDSLTGVQNIVAHSKEFICSDNCLFTADMRNLFYFFHNGEDYLEIPIGVEKIGDYAFSRSEIQKIIIPETVVEIGQNAFANCLNLEEISIPQSVKKIGNSAFYECENLHRVNLPKNIEIIEGYTFGNCRNLEYIRLPDNVKEILSNAFQNTGIKSIILPVNLKFIGHDPFVGCDIERIVSSSDKFIVKNMAIYTDNGKTFVNYYGKEQRFEIPEGVEKIADFALSFAYSIQELVFPSTITEVGKMILDQALPQKILVPLKIKDLIIEKLPSYYAKHVHVIENDSD